MTAELLLCWDPILTLDMAKLEFIKAWAILTSWANFGVELGLIQIQDGITTYPRFRATLDYPKIYLVLWFSQCNIYKKKSSPTIMQFPWSSCPILGMLRSHIDSRYDQNRDYKGLGYPHLRNLFLGLS